VIIERQFAIEIEAKPADKLRGSDSDGGPVKGESDGGREGGRGGSARFSSPREVHTIHLFEVESHPNLFEKIGGMRGGGGEDGTVFAQGIRDGQERKVVHVHSGADGKVDGREDGVGGEFFDDGSDVETGENGGDWGALGDSNENICERGDRVVEMDGNLAVREEARYPLAHLSRKAHVPESMDHASMIDMVKETLDVNGKEGRDETRMSSAFNVVREGEASVKTRRI